MVVKLSCIEICIEDDNNTLKNKCKISTKTQPNGQLGIIGHILVPLGERFIRMTAIGGRNYITSFKGTGLY